jgi:hypothetical protein
MRLVWRFHVQPSTRTAAASSPRATGRGGRCSSPAATDIEVGYVTTFLDGSLALQTNASYQMNFAGQTGANSVSLLSRARIKF